MSVGSSAIIGLIAGVLVVFAVLFFDKVKLDDPVGALSVHLVCGVFGTICVGLFAQDAIMPNTTGDGLLFGGGMKLLLAQLLGVAAAAVYTLTISLVFWGAIKAAMGLRVTAEEEIEGLDVGEHGNSAYPDFTQAVPSGYHGVTGSGGGHSQPAFAPVAQATR